MTVRVVLLTFVEQYGLEIVLSPIYVLIWHISLFNIHNVNMKQTLL